MTGTHDMPDHQKYYLTPQRPGNFGEVVDFKANIDDFFETNRVHNEQDTKNMRTQLYILNALFYGGMLSYARLYAIGVMGRFTGWTRYDKDTYAEFDVGEVPPGECIQVVWNGTPVFIRRLTKQEMAEEEALPKETLLDPSGDRELKASSNTDVLICSAVCTHLGCIPIPYLGSYSGWVCICHGSVYDKLGRVRQGPALKNLPTINSSMFGDIVCMEEEKYPREPSTRFWA